MSGRKVVYAVPDFQHAKCVLLENDGLEVKTYECERSWLTIEHDGRVFRLNGRDVQTGEYLYLPDVEPPEVVGVGVANAAAGVR